MLSFLPNFAPAPRVAGAWANTAQFAWSTPHVPTGFVDRRGWTNVVKPGSNVLVLPTGDRSAASYWQAKSGMRFALAIPATPFVPPKLAAAPVVRGLADNDLPNLAGPAIAAGRLRAFLIDDRVGAVIVTHSGVSLWRRVVAEATAARPVRLAGADVYRVAPTLDPLRALGKPVVARARLTRAALASSHRGSAPAARAWVRFDGNRGHAQVLLRTGATRSGRAVTLSSPSGDAELVAAAVDSRGRAAVVFTEWRNHEELLRGASYASGSWRVATLDRSAEPIWAPRVIITPGGTTLATWIDQADPIRTARAAALPPGGTWQRPISLERADGLQGISIATGSGSVGVLAWHDSIANEIRVRAITYENGVWSPVATLATSQSAIRRVKVAGLDATEVRWRLDDRSGAHAFRARRKGTIWIEG